MGLVWCFVLVVGVGIDAGGTNTYAVVLDLDSHVILGSGSAPTSHFDFSLGIVGAIRIALEDSRVLPERVDVVSVATTLATNAIVEGKGCRVGLLMIGYEPEPEWAVPASFVRVVRGGFDEVGEEVAPLDDEEVRVAVRDMSRFVDGLAISSFFGVRNPSHEIRARLIARDVSDLPTVCGFEFTSELGLPERTVTAVLNAKLIPIIDTLLEELKKGLRGIGMGGARLFVVKGSGSIISESLARERPVETILSGPAASAVGAWVLTKREDGIVIDVGGTTTDISFLEGDCPVILESGATVGGFKTRVQAVDSTSIGLGGDSWVRLVEAGVEVGEGEVAGAGSGAGGFLQIGPERVVPLAFASLEIPELLDLMREEGSTYFFRALKRARFLKQPVDETLFEVISRRPVWSFEDLSQETWIDPESLNLLIFFGLVEQIGVTPTDVLHVDGTFVRGDVEAARFGLGLLAERFGMSLSGFCEEVKKRFAEIIVDAVRSKWKERLDPVFFIDLPETLKPYFIEKYKVRLEAEKARIDALLRLPIIGLGAPAGVYIKWVGDFLGSGSIVPPDSRLGGALGAISSRIMETAFILVQRTFREDAEVEEYVVHLPTLGRRVFHDRYEAVDFAINLGKEIAMEKAGRAGAEKAEIKMQKKDVFMKAFGGSTYVRSEIIVTAISPPV